MNRSRRFLLQGLVLGTLMGWNWGAGHESTTECPLYGGERLAARVYSVVGEKRLYADVRRGALYSSPSWDALGGEDLPLSVPVAYGLATNALAHVVTNQFAFVLERLDLRRGTCPCDARSCPAQRKWWYEFLFQFRGTTLVNSSYVIIPVLMDGTVIEPRAETP